MAGSTRTRTTIFFECDHLRPLVQDAEGAWHHITDDGGLGPVCGASSVYRMEATVIGQHDMTKFVRGAAASGRAEGSDG